MKLEVGSLMMLVVLLPGCGGSGSEEEQVGEPSGAKCPTNSVLTYENFGRQFMSDYCTRCHSESLTGAARKQAPTEHNFDTVELIREQSEHIDQVAAAAAGATVSKHSGGGVNASMPPDDPKPTLEDRARLGEWLACGAR